MISGDQDAFAASQGWESFQPQDGGHRTLQTTTSTTHPMTPVPKFMGFLYSGMLGMIAIYGILFFYFMGKEERDPNLLGEGSGCCANMYSLFIRVLPLLMKLGHYGVLILIVVQVSTVFFGSGCESPYYFDTFGVKKSSPVVQLAQWGTAISAWFWVNAVNHQIMIHIIFPGWRKMLHPVFFQYEPDDPSRNAIWALLFIYWGPN